MTSTTQTTKRSTRRLSEVARHVIIPAGITSTGWPAVERQCREFGDEFDEWQRGAGQLILGKDADDVYAATVGGVTLSIPRQVAKTFLVGRIVFALCVLFPGLRVIWTAHRTRTATNTFKHLAGYAKRPKVAPHVAGIRTANGEQEITFTNGSIIMFGAREQGFGRGFDEIDVEVFDEAQILTEKALEDMVAATNQSRHPHGALLFYMGTPPRPVDPGEAFTLRREAALAHKPDPDVGFDGPVEGDDSLYIECSADRGAKPDDPKQWAIANPSYPHRTPHRSLLRLRKNLPGDDSWLREALGVWDEAITTPTVVRAEQWMPLAVEHPPVDGVLVYGVKFAAAGDRVALTVALRPDDEPTHLELVACRPLIEGTGWLEDWLVERWRGCRRIVVDGKSHAGALELALMQRKVPAKRIVRPTVDQVIAAHAGFVEAVVAGGLTHFGSDVDGELDALSASVLSAVKRPIGTQGGWGFDSRLDGVDVTPAESAVLAHYGAAVAPSKTRTGRVVVMG